MAFRVVLFITFVALAHSDQSAPLTGGFSPLEYGGYNEWLKFNPGPFWGGMSQDNYRRYQSPITFRAGGNFLNSQGHGLTGNVALESGVGGKGSLRGDFPVINNPVHKVDGFAKVESNLNKHLNPVGPQTDTFGVNYKNADGTTASFTQTQTHGNPATKTIGASIPVVNTDSHLLKLSGENIIGQKQTLGVKYEHKDTGATASLSGTQTKVGPARGTAGVSIPISNVGPATVTVEGKSTFGHGMKPDSQVGVQVSIPLQ